MTRRRATTTARGYGHPHRVLRNQWEPIVQTGHVTCSRHGHPLFPRCPGKIRPGTPWELGHDDHDRTRYTGPEHRACNRRAGALKRQGKLNPAPRPTTLRW